MEGKIQIKVMQKILDDLSSENLSMSEDLAIFLAMATLAAEYLELDPNALQEEFDIIMDMYKKNLEKMNKK